MNCECEKAQFLERNNIFELRIDQAVVKYRSTGCDSCTYGPATASQGVVLEFNPKYEKHYIRSDSLETSGNLKVLKDHLGMSFDKCANIETYFGKL